MDRGVNKLGEGGGCRSRKYSSIYTTRVHLHFTFTDTQPSVSPNNTEIVMISISR